VAWWENGLGGPQREGGPVDVSLLAERVMRLAPRMPAKDREPFAAAFRTVWPHIDRDGPLDPACPFAQPDGEHEVLIHWINIIAARRTPVASAKRQRIEPGDAVAYPVEFEVLTNNLDVFSYYYGRIGQHLPLDLTHLDLSLRVEFAPLLAALFTASRVGGIVDRGPVPGWSHTSGRVQEVILLEVLLARRPHDKVLPYVDWLTHPRAPLWTPREHFAIG